MQVKHFRGSIFYGGHEEGDCLASLRQMLVPFRAYINVFVMCARACQKGEVMYIAFGSRSGLSEADRSQP